jgi:Protein of unknown function (DUF2452)
MEEKKNPNALTHGITPSAPASLKPVEIDKWIGKVEPTFKHYYQERYDDLVRQYEQLAHDYNINKMCYEASLGFEPNMGQIYHLYRRKDGTTFLSLVEPQHAYFGEHLGSYRLNAQYAWEEV